MAGRRIGIDAVDLVVHAYLHVVAPRRRLDPNAITVTGQFAAAQTLEFVR